MRITDLLDKRSINLNAAPKTKSEALDMAVELMAKSGKIDDIESYRAKVYAVPLMHQDLQKWLLRMELILNRLMMSR